MVMRHGVVTPVMKAGQTPARVMNARSRRKNPINKHIRLDKLLRSSKPKILVKRCLAEDTDILLSDGSLRKIKDINIGDEVIDQTGKPTKITNKFYNGVSTELIEFRSSRTLSPIKCTPDHKILVFDTRPLRKNLNVNPAPGVNYFLKKQNWEQYIRWVPARELDQHTFLLTPNKINLRLVEQNNIDLSYYLEDNTHSQVTNTHILSAGKSNKTRSLQQIADKLKTSYYIVAEVSRNKQRLKYTKNIHHKIKRELDRCNFNTYTNRLIKVGYKFGKFIGLMLGDGSARLRYKNNYISSGEVTIAINSEYEEQIIEIQNLIKELFNLESTLYRNPNRDSKCVQIFFYSIPIAKMLLEIYDNNKEKKLPDGFLFDNNKYLRGLLDGLIQSDGTSTHSRFTNTSKYLVSLTYWLKLRLEGPPGISLDKRKKTSFFKNGQAIYSKKTAFYVYNLKHPEWQTIIYNGQKYNISKLVYKKELIEEVKLWDLEVESNTHSFVAENTVVHNCLGGIGDVLMTTPLLKAFKDLIPRCELTYATDLQYAEGALGEVIKHNPYVDKLISNEQIRDAEYDYSVDVTTTGLSRERAGTIPPNRIDMFAEEVGISVSSDPVPIYIVKTSERKKAIGYLERLVGGKNKTIIAVQSKSNDVRRTWPFEHVQKLCELLTEEDENIHVLLFDWGKTQEYWKATNDRIHLVFDSKFVDTAAIIEQVALVICPDSSILHLAGAFNKKIVTVFGPIPPESRINHYINATALTGKCILSPCWYSTSCNKSTGIKRMQCLADVTPEMVCKAAIKKLAEPAKEQQNIIYGKDLTEKGQDPVILIRRKTTGLGDMLSVTPSINAIKRKYPDKEIHVACQKNIWPILQNNPDISEILDVEDSFNYKRYFMVIDISSPCARYEMARISAGKPVQKSRAEVFAEAMDVRSTITSLKPNYYITQEEKKTAKEFIAYTSTSKKPKIAIALTSAENYRDWPEDNNIELFKLLNKKFEPVLLSHTRNNLYEKVIDACGFSIRKAVAILAECDGLITVDTSFLHFSAALNIPTIALFGPIDYRPRCKGYDNVTVLKTNLDCIPCWRNSHMACQQTNLISGYSKCLSDISAEDIYKIASKKFG